MSFVLMDVITVLCITVTLWIHNSQCYIAVVVHCTQQRWLC